MNEPKGERIAKVMARAGLCSRRDAEKWIAAGRVVLDGAKVTTPATLVTPASRIVVDGKPLPQAEPLRVWRYHKPAGLVVTQSDPEGRRTIFDALPKNLPRVLTIGRLDLSSEGLLLLTNDGALKRHLELPSTGWTRRYRVRVRGQVETQRLLPLAKGITLDGVRYGPIEAVLDNQRGSNAWLTVGLKEGKNREIRKIFDHLGWPVNRLIRIAYGPFQLGNLAAGTVEEVAPRILRQQLGAFAKVKKGAPCG